MTTTTHPKDPVKWFRTMTGYDQKKSKKLAAAEERARDEGMRFRWFEDAGDERFNHTVWAVEAYLNSEEPVGSCYSIDLGKGGSPYLDSGIGGGSLYARVCEAELALEALT